MDGVTLLRRAHDAGLRVEAAGDKLLIRGPKRAEPVVKLLAEHKAALLEALMTYAASTSSWFRRAIPAADGEPGLEQPCAARRGRVQELDRAFLHFCLVCGAFGAFGYGVSLRAGRLGRWYCAAHRPEVQIAAENSHEQQCDADARSRKA
jgi:hypothetical protein